MQTISRVGGIITKAAACQAARQEFARQFQTMAASMDYWHLYACRGGLGIAQMGEREPEPVVDDPVDDRPRQGARPRSRPEPGHQAQPEQGRVSRDVVRRPVDARDQRKAMEEEEQGQECKRHIDDGLNDLAIDQVA